VKLTLQTLLLAAVGAACLVLSSGETSAGAPAPEQKIVYQCRGDQSAGGGFDICSVNADGTGYQRLTHDSTEDSAPRISPDGGSIVWRRDIVDLWIMDSDGSNQRELLPDIIGQFGPPTWSPDGHMIAFICNDPDAPNVDGICQTDPEGTSFDMVWVLEPRPVYIEWSPVNRDQMLIEQADGANEDIYILNWETGATTNLTNTPDDYEHGTWSPDGFEIAFVGSPLPTDGVSLVSLYRMDASGGNRERLFTSDWSAPATHPAWSPMNNQIAYFCSHTDVGLAEICVVDPVSASLDELLQEGVTDQYYLGKSPDWGFVDGPLFGDFDCDGDVDGDDLLILLQVVNGKDDTEPCISLDGNEVNLRAQPAADLNCDGDVDARDGLPILLAQIGAPPIETNCAVVGAVAQIFEV
jgi:Tol biopolymer transport system component